MVRYGLGESARWEVKVGCGTLGLKGGGWEVQVRGGVWVLTRTGWNVRHAGEGECSLGAEKGGVEG